MNLNPYMGVCAEFPDVCIVSEYCAKGSLQVLELIGAWDWNRQKGPFLMCFCGDPVISIAIFVALKPQPAAMSCMFFFLSHNSNCENSGGIILCWQLFRLKSVPSLKKKDAVSNPLRKVIRGF